MVRGRITDFIETTRTSRPISGILGNGTNCEAVVWKEILAQHGLRVRSVRIA
jgi:hypothetical protein